MKKKWLILAALFPMLSWSQDNHSGTGLHTITSAGLIVGESAAKPLFQVSGGITYSRYYTGIGVGLDFYNFKSVPVYADWRIHFGDKLALFAYANGGYSIPYDNKSEFPDSPFKTTDRFYGGLYIDAGFGYRIKLSSLHRLSFSAGYSHANINNEVGYNYQVCIDPPCSELHTYHYNMGRIVTKLSWELGR